MSNVRQSTLWEFFSFFCVTFKISCIYVSDDAKFCVVGRRDNINTLKMTRTYMTNCITSLTKGYYWSFLTFYMNMLISNFWKVSCFYFFFVITVFLASCYILFRIPSHLQRKWAWDLVLFIKDRNLCQNNLENQKVVAKIDKKGQLDKKKLSELGIDIFDDEQK